MATLTGVRRGIPAWRQSLGDLFIATGVFILVIGALFWTRTALVSSQVSSYRFLPSNARPKLPLPELVDVGGLLQLASSPAPATPEAGLLPIPIEEQPGPEINGLPVVPAAAEDTEPAVASSPTMAATLQSPSKTAEPTPDAVTLAVLETSPVLDPTPSLEPPVAQTEAPVPRVSEAPAVTETPAPPAPPATPKPKPTKQPTLPPYSAVVRLVIPKLEVDRAVVPVGLRPGSSGSLEWDTDALFATRNRPDLVGQMVGSYSPGQGGNIILIGHNYNQVDYGWTGVFVNIKSLSAGDVIGVFTEDGRQTNYKVVQVKQVPWRSKNESELEKHMKYMGASPRERLTLVTCGGANIWPFPARVYVVAEPVR